MKKEKENEDTLGIRLNLNKKDDQPIFDYFINIKSNLGMKTNTEVARICIKKAYEFWFKKKIINKEGNDKS